MALGRGFGGYQYSEAFLRRAEQETLRRLRGETILSFHHHFPRAAHVQAAGGQVVYYLDATLAAELDGRAIELSLSSSTAARALAIERDNLAKALHVVTMARWLRDYLINHRLVASERVSVVLPGANLDVDESWLPPSVPQREPGQFVFGVVGNDWRRKGVPLLVEVVRHLQSRGIAAKVQVIGKSPRDLAPGVADVLGPIDKAHDLSRFVSAVQGFDLGCLFAEREALGISVLEFLRLGVPVAGFAHDGPADTLPPDAGFRFAPNLDAAALASALEPYIRSPYRQQVLRTAAARWSSRVTWERCLRELSTVLSGKTVIDQVRPWMASGSL